MKERTKQTSFRLFKNEEEEGGGDYDEEELFNWKRNRRLVKIVNEARVSVAMFRSSQKSSQKSSSYSEADPDVSEFDWFDDEQIPSATNAKQKKQTIDCKDNIIVSPIPHKAERLAPNTHTSRVLATLKSVNRDEDTTMETMQTCSTIVEDDDSPNSDDEEKKEEEEKESLVDVKKNLRFGDDEDEDEKSMLVTHTMLVSKQEEEEEQAVCTLDENRGIRYTRNTRNIDPSHGATRALFCDIPQQRCSVSLPVHTRMVLASRSVQSRRDHS